MEAQLLSEIARYEKFTASTRLETLNTDKQIENLIREIEDIGQELARYRQNCIESGTRGLEAGLAEGKRPVRKVQSFCISNDRVTESRHAEMKESIKADEGLPKRESLVSVKGVDSNPSTTDQSLVMNNKSGASGQKGEHNMQKSNGQNSLFSVAAKVNTFSFIDGSLKHSEFIARTMRKTERKTKPAPKVALPKAFQNSNQQEEFAKANNERLLTFSDSKNEIYDCSVVLEESKATPDAPVDRKTAQRHNSCARLEGSNTHIRTKSKRGIRLPVTFTNLDDILNVKGVNSGFKATRVGKLNTQQ